MGVSCVQRRSVPFGSVVVADDHRLVAQGIERLLMDCFDSIVLVSSGEQLLATLRRETPDMVVSDISMPGISGLEVMRQVRSEGCLTPFLFLTMHDESSLAAEAIRAGARGILPSRNASDECGASQSCDSSSACAGRSRRDSPASRSAASPAAA